MNLLPALNPVVRVFDNPLCVVDSDLEFLYQYVPTVGTSLRQHIPLECGRAVLVVNGKALMQRDWNRLVLPADQIEWHVLSGGKGASRAVLTIIAAIAIAYFTAGLGLSTFYTAALNVALNLAAGLLINALIPIKADTNSLSNSTPGSVYNTSLASNQARLNQPIPVIYGRMRTFPDFAAQPYARYTNNDQYYYALFCIGQGSYAIEALQIDDTPIANFVGVSYNVLAPGVAPTQVKANIVTAIEVAGNKLVADVPIGGFIVCKSRKTVTKIEFDFAAEQGLGSADNSGNFVAFNVVVQINLRYVDDFGTPTTDYVSMGTVTLTAASRTAQRFTFSLPLATAGRPMVQMVRVTPETTSNLILDAITWTGLRGTLSDPAPLCATATHLEVVMKASEQLNGITQKKINVIARRLLRALTPTGFAGTLTESRSIPAAICDAISDTTYGGRRPDSEIDFATMYALDQIYAARQDRLDILFDSRTTVRDALKTMAQVGRAVVLQRLGVFTMMRDQYQPLPFAAYTTRDIIPGTTALNYALTTPETPDAISYEYFNNRSWDWVPILCKSPGVVTPVNTVTLRVSGVTGAFHALREGTYLAAVNLYRRQFPKWQSEMKGLLASYGSPVIFSPALPNWGQPGDVVSYDDVGLIATLSEPPTWTTGASHFITLEKPTGQLTIAIPVTKGSGPRDVVLGLAPGFTLTTDDTDTERTKYVFGPAGQHQRIVRLLGVARKGKSAENTPIVELMGVTENNLVHTADNAYLPAGGVIQDPVPSTTIDAGVSGTVSTISLQSHVSPAGTLRAIGDTNLAGGVRFRLFNDGTAGFKIYDTGPAFESDTPSSTGVYPGEWLAADAEPALISKYEVKVSLSSDTTGYLQRSSNGFDTWINLSSVAELYWDYGFSQTHPPLAFHGPNVTIFLIGLFSVAIRKVGGAANAATATIEARISYLAETAGVIGGGG